MRGLRPAKSLRSLAEEGTARDGETSCRGDAEAWPNACTAAATSLQAWRAANARAQLLS